MYYYEVAPLKIVRQGSDTFTYSSEDALPLGCIVTIPVGKSTLTGLIMTKVQAPPYATKQIASRLELPPLPPALLHTATWMASYYHTPLATVLQTILPRGITKKRRATKAALPKITRARTNFLLNSDQTAALAALESSASGTVMLHGVTGSGKTAVYIEYAKRLLSRGKSVIILVPEIALTSQLVAEFQHYFPNIILTHSHQTEAERHLSWVEALTSTEPRVVIGPRSALFAPLQTIGAIIIDEAHEPSYKQEQSPRYSALRVASILAKEHRGLAIQGSATPLIAEYYLANYHHQPIITLPRPARHDAQAPVVAMVDMTKRGNFTEHRFLSDTLLATMRSTLEQGYQVLVFHNRRGSASTTLCKACGWSAMCPRCFVPFTLHADTHVLRCHICDTTERVPTSCPLCQSTDIVHKGIGTKLLESELAKLFPGKKIMRFDGDSQSDATVERSYQALYEGSIDIIIGTQVVAKGLDLPHLRAVGVVQADAGLTLPDFTASERTFQLLAQVIGRVGRSSHNTTVVVQSYQPDAAAVRYGIAQEYQHFYNETLALRARAGFPPYAHLLKLTCAYKTEAAAVRNARELATKLRSAFPGVTILGPTPSFYERQRDTYRWQITVKSSTRSQLLKIIATLPPRGWQYDIDPASLL